MSNDKRNVILFSYGPAVIAGMSNGIDADLKPDKYRSVMDIFNCADIFVSGKVILQPQGKEFFT